MVRRMTEQPNWEFIIPKETPTLNIKQSNWYKVDVEKLHSQRMEDVAYLFATMMVSEDYEHFDKVKKFLIIPEKPKTLEQIQQELDEKIDDLIERTKNNFYKSKYIAETLYETKFNRIIENFEYAKEHGQFPPKLTYSNLIATGSNITSTFVIKQGNNHEGYYTFGNCRSFRYYMPTKPNFIVRFCMDNLLGFKWIDDK
jgi:hypothetical protein